MATFSQHQTSALQSHCPKFCTIIIHPEDNYLKIEKEFARRYGGDLPHTVFLKVHASDKLWKIKLFKSENGELLFKNGWEEFKQYYFLSLGDFLVFKFDTSSSTFDVFLYDKTSVHIVGHIDEETRSESNGGLGQVAESHKRKKDKMAFCEEQESTKKRSKSAPKTNNDRMKLSCNTLGGTNSSLNKNKKGCDDKERFHFSKTMQKYHQYRVDFPGCFARNAGICEKDIIILKVNDTEGKEWPVNVTKRAAAYSLCAGWIEFVTDNKVTIGSRITFLWLAKSTILVKILDAGTKQMLITSTSRRGKQLELLELSDSDVENEDDI